MSRRAVAAGNTIKKSPGKASGKKARGKARGKASGTTSGKKARGKKTPATSAPAVSGAQSAPVVIAPAVQTASAQQTPSAELPANPPAEPPAQPPAELPANPPRTSRTKNVAHIILMLVLAAAATLSASLLWEACALALISAYAPTRPIRLIRFVVCYPLALLPLACFFLGRNTVNAWLHAHRWPLGGAVIFAATLLNLNGSSMSMWPALLGYGNSTILNDVLFGFPTMTSTDEYTVTTAFASAQQYANYPLINPLLGTGSGTNMFIVKDAPYWGLGMVFRPFQWGYLLFGFDRGLAFYWSARLVVLFLVSYEFCRLLTTVRGAEHRGLAVFGALLITFAPLVVWRFAVNNLPEMLIAAFGSVVLFHFYLASHTRLVRAGLALAIAECAGMFGWSLYLPWMIPVAWILLACIIWQLADAWGTVRMRVADWAILAFVFVVFCALTGVLVWQSWDAIHDTLTTSYPGRRTSTGGGFPVEMILFGSVAPQLVPLLYSINVPVAMAEAGGVFADFFPLGLFILVGNCVFNRKELRRDLLSVLLVVVMIVLGTYVCVGFPERLSRITLLGWSLTTRVAPFLYLVNLLLLLRGAACKEWRATTFVSLVTGIALGVGAAYFTIRYWECRCADVGAQPVSTLATMGVVAFIEYLLVTLAVGLFTGVRDTRIVGRPPASAGSSSHRFVRVVRSVSAVRAVSVTRAVALVLVAVFCTFTGALANPVKVGADDMADLPVVQQAVAANTVQEGTFAVVSDSSIFLPDVLAANGLSTLNTVQVTPRWSMWNILDPDGRYGEQYNRYALIFITPTVKSLPRGSLYIANTVVDQIHVSLTARQLHDLGVTYVVSDYDLAHYAAAGYRYVQVVPAVGSYAVWRIEAADAADDLGASGSVGAHQVAVL